MKIKKIGEEVTYFQKTISHIFVINGKEIRVYDYQKQDNVFEDYDSEIAIDEKDAELLTDNETEAINDEINELCDMKESEVHDFGDIYDELPEDNKII